MVELEKTLSFPVILIITINSIMGTGIFFLPALGAKLAGPMSIISWIIMALIAMGVSLIFAELVGMYPFAGGVYEYTKQAFGPVISFLVGWLTIIAGNVTIAMLIVGAVQYLSPVLPAIIKIIISIGFILAFNFMAFRGMQTSAVMLVAFGIITLTSILGLTIPGLLHFQASNFVPFATHSIPVMLLTVFFIAETFFGWETATFLAEETKDAKHVMPKAMWLGTLIISIIVLLFVLSSLGSIHWTEFGLSATPLADLATLHYGAGATVIFSLLVYLSIIGSVAGWIVSAPRLLMSLAQDKLFIPTLADVHPRFKTPHKAILFQSILTSILVVIGAGSYETLLHLLLPMVLILYTIVIVSFLILRNKKPEQERPFKVWAGKTLGYFLILVISTLIFIWLILDPGALHTLGLAAGFLILGIPIFFLLMFYYNPDAIILFMENFAHLHWLFEGINIPKRVRREIVYSLPDLKGKKVLDFGAGVGTVSKHLMKHIGEKGHIIAIDMSKKNLNILEKRLKRKKYMNFTTLHDPHQISRVHPKTPFVDVVVSVGMLSYIQDMKKVLYELHRLLPEGGGICFVEFIDFFWFLPNAGWLKDEQKLLELFQETGFKVELVKINSLFWKYMFIYGKKTRHMDRVFI